MKLDAIVSAAPALQKLVTQDLPLQAAFEISRLIDAINPCLEFYGREYLKAIAATDSDAAVSALREFDAGVEIPNRVGIPLSTPLVLTPADVKFLAPFIDFTGRREGT